MSSPSRIRDSRRNQDQPDLRPGQTADVAGHVQGTIVEVPERPADGGGRPVYVEGMPRRRENGRRPAYVFPTSDEEIAHSQQAYYAQCASAKGMSVEQYLATLPPA
jgi:hypothetical protein